MRTTIMLEDELYKKLVSESVERFGTTRNLSQLINGMLKEKITQLIPEITDITYKAADAKDKKADAGLQRKIKQKSAADVTKV